MAETVLRKGDGTVVSLLQATRAPRDPERVQGAIRLVADSEPVLGGRLWCQIVPFWLGIADALDQLAATGQGSTPVPGATAELSLTRLFGGKIKRVRLTVTGIREPKRVVVDEPDITGLLRSAGALFFTEMARISPINVDTYQRYGRRFRY